MVVYLVEMTPVKTVVDRIRTGKVRSKDEVIRHIVAINADPEVEASSFSVALKDPLTLARIKTPVRSVQCTHVACFDAEMWFTLNEQTPTWTCPICSKVLKPGDLILDGWVD